MSPQLPLEVAVSKSPVTTGSGSATSSLALQITNSDQGGTFATPDVAGLAFGSFNSTRQGIVGGTFGNDFLEFFTAGDFTHARLFIDASGNVGVGTATPSTVLHVNGAITAKSTGSGFIADDGTAKLNLGFGGSHAGVLNNTVGSVSLATGGTNCLTAATNGNVGIGVGTTTPGGTLDVHHVVSNAVQEIAFIVNKELIGVRTSPVINVRTFDNSGTFNCELNEGQAFKPGGGSWGIVSDRRLKKDIEPLNGALEHLLRLRSVTYQYIDPVKSHQFAGTQTGFIAQEVEGVFPEWVTENAEGFKTVTIRGFESLAVQALRELRTEKDAEIQKLTAENTALAEKVAALEAQNKAREARLARIEKALDAQPARATTAVLELK